MTLVSPVFLFGFLPIVVIGTHVLRDRWSLTSAKLWVLCASLVFYGTADWRYLPLMLGSAAINWAIGRGLDEPWLGAEGRKRLFALGLGIDVLVLAVAKWAPFLVGSVLVPWFPLPPQWSLPLGLSFFTISQIMYLVDRYESLVPANGATDHALFVSFFPNVTAGPIERARHFVGQIQDLGSAASRDERLARSIGIGALGLFKKLVLADSFGRIANAGYAHVGTLSTLGAWATAIAYAFEIYFDFSGYSDLAVGAAGLLGIRLAQNFNAPFRARTISEFWQRWHISLSSFLTTYLFTPLLRGMGRVTRRKAALAAVITMTIAGIWHGPSWTFVLWGMSQGIGIAIYQYWKQWKRPLPALAATLVTFGFTCVTMIAFRSPTVSVAMRLSLALVPGVRPLGVVAAADAIVRGAASIRALPTVIGGVAAFAGPTSSQLAAAFRPSGLATAGVTAVIAVSLLFALIGTPADFMYRVF